MNSIIAQFDVNPYHWPGWAQASLSASVGLLTLLFFVETRSLSQAKTSCSNAVSCLAGIKLEAQLQTKCSKLASYMFLCGCGFLGGMMFTIVSALAPPVLSDQFGFDVENTSHYLLVMSSAYLISSILQLAAKCARIDNRKILGLGIIFAMAGSVMFGDWQAVHNDPCHFPPTSNSTANSFPSSTLYTSGENATDALCLGDSVTNSSYLQGLVQSCEDLSSSSNECFWNRQSRVTSTYCYTCLGVCLSLQKSQNIYQLSMGVMLLSISAGFLFVFSSAVVSDVASVKSQGKVVSSVIGSGSLARCISPLWFIKSYEMTSRHSYFAMAITAGYALVLLICLAALFKNLAPRDRGSALSATSKFHSYPVDQDPTGSGEIAEVQDDDDLENQTFPFETTV
ncbi:hypothetical protein GBAR_LOCUS11454 [Geodia barretti]|nr:hypothetical protein GBAR_LOCUS11454 [Geodia barretti]